MASLHSLLESRTMDSKRLCQQKGDAARTNIAQKGSVSKKVTQHGQTLGLEEKNLAVSKNVSEEDGLETTYETLGFLDCAGEAVRH